MFSVFGDSHARCFKSVYPNTVYSYSAASAKGLSNEQSKSGVNKKIRDVVMKLPDHSNLIFFFGKVDLDFILNYKYNTIGKMDYKEYIRSILQSYLSFVKSITMNKRVYLCELPITHIQDKAMLDILNIKSHVININTHLSETDQSKPISFSKVLPYKERIELYMFFNQELKTMCAMNQFTCLDINSYFKTENGSLKIPLTYINQKDPLDHHLLPNIVELYMKSLAQCK